MARRTLRLYHGRFPLFFSYTRLRAKDTAEGENRPRKAVEVVHRWLKKTRLYFREGEQKIRKTKLRKKNILPQPETEPTRGEKRSKANGDLLCIQLTCTLLFASLFFPPPLEHKGDVPGRTRPSSAPRGHFGTKGQTREGGRNATTWLLLHQSPHACLPFSFLRVSSPCNVPPAFREGGKQERRRFGRRSKVPRLAHEEKRRQAG